MAFVAAIVENSEYTGFLFKDGLCLTDKLKEAKRFSEEETKIIIDFNANHKGLFLGDLAIFDESQITPITKESAMNEVLTYIRSVDNQDKKNEIICYLANEFFCFACEPIDIDVFKTSSGVYSADQLLSEISIRVFYPYLSSVFVQFFKIHLNKDLVSLNDSLFLIAKS